VGVREEQQPSGWRGHLRHYLRGLDHTGIVIGLLFFASSLTPSLLPRPWALQGVLSGVTFAGGYGLGVVVSATATWIGVPRPGARFRWRAWLGVGMFALVVLPVILWLASGWEQDVHRAVGEARGARAAYLVSDLGVLSVAVGVAAGLIGLVRLAIDIYRVLLRRLLRVLPRALARVLATIMVAALAVGFLSGVVYRGLLRLADRTFSAADHSTAAGIVRPTSPLRSGGPSSLVSWASLGEYGREFVAAGPTPTQIRALTGRPAVMPIRVFAGSASAPSLTAQADVVLAELKRTRAFSRPLLAVATTTGRGWIDSAQADPLEYMYGGDTAIASIQYSYLPSWLAFVTDHGRAAQAGRVLFDTVYDYWSQLPPTARPRLVVFGESLGAYGSNAAFSGAADFRLRTGGALYTGPPNFTQPWRAMVDDRTGGSPERLPEYGNGQVVRFAATAADLSKPTGTAPTVVYLQHASDPIVWWSTALIWRRPAWLAESRGTDVLPQVHWYPFVTFWQITGDLPFALDPPAGHGHHYGPEVPAAWAAILRVPSWTASDTAELSAGQFAP
jgi:uncharacterized membrane protein